MAEIMVSGTEAATEQCEPSPTAPTRQRRRRVEVHRYKFVAGAETMAIAGELSRKRSKLGRAKPSPPRPTDGEEDDPRSDLEIPRVKLWEPSGSDECPRYGLTSVCGRRRDMEDAVSIRPDFVEGSSAVVGKFHFFGVFDGHGCSHVAVSCEDRMHEIVRDEMERVGPGPAAADDGGGWKRVMERSFSRMDAEAVSCSGGTLSASCRCELQTPKCDHVGSTAVVAVVSGDSIVVSNCGDSRAVLCRRGVPVPLSSDHKPDRPDELERIQAAGGRVIYWDGARVLGVLAMSRAIGDSYLKPFVTSEPEVTVTERSEGDECLILASDGLWDVVTNEVACGVVRMCLRNSAPGSDKGCSDAAMLLTKLALARQSADNVSVVVVDLRRD